jgi:hypothetical protein
MSSAISTNHKIFPPSSVVDPITVALFAATEALTAVGIKDMLIATDDSARQMGADLAELRRLRAIADERFLTGSSAAGEPTTAPMARARALARSAALTAASDGARLMTVKETAAWLRKSQSFVYRHAHELGVRRVGSGRGGDLLFKISDVEAWIEAKRYRQ